MPYTRITNGYLSERVVQNLFTNRSKLVDLQTQISSGKRISKPSDDVVASTSLVNANNSLSRIENYLKNVDVAQNEVDTADKVLLSAIDYINEARELTIQAANASSGPQELLAIKAQIDQIVDQMKDIGNTKFGTKYIFGGRTTDAPPFEVPANGQITYVGSPSGSHERSVEISDGVNVPVNVDGEEVFGFYYLEDDDADPMTPDIVHSQGVIGALRTLSERLGAAIPDKNQIRSSLEDLESSLEGILFAESQIGGVSSRIELTKNNLAGDKINVTKIKSGAEDIDMAKAISDLQFQQTALQASLQISAQVIQPSLLNYI
jgi:flagellar hook-associated protein 3 FlgL